MMPPYVFLSALAVAGLPSENAPRRIRVEQARPFADRCGLVLEILHRASDGYSHDPFFESVRTNVARKATGQMPVKVVVIPRVEGTGDEFPLFSEDEDCSNTHFRIIRTRDPGPEEVGVAVGHLILIRRAPGAFEFFGSVLVYDSPKGPVGNIFCGQTHGEARRSEGKVLVRYAGVPLPPGLRGG